MADPGARDTVDLVVTSFEPFPGPAGPDVPSDGPLDGPLGWPGYAGTLARARAATGTAEAVVCGTGLVGDTRSVIISFDFRFVGGSVGSRTGDLVCAALDEARRSRLPVVSLIATGGSRMQEGMHSLRQLARITAGCARNRAAGIAHVAVLRHPTTGGIWATLGSGADVIVGVRGATVAFAGRRVRGDAEDTDDFRADGKYRYGQCDLLVDPAELPETLGSLTALLDTRELDAQELDTGELDTGELDARGIAPAPVPRALGDLALPADGWAAVRRARRADRPRAVAYLDDYFSRRTPLSGDRAGGADAGMLCGLGQREDRTIAYVAQTGTANTPAGFRTATRTIRLAERLRLPVLTLIDTPGAANDAAAERSGVGPAIAELFSTISTCTVPVTTLVIGEGGSGGALALASTDRLWITPDGYFSVIAPEAAAAILRRDDGEVPAIAAQLRLRPQDLVQEGLVDGIAGARPSTPGRVPSPPPPTSATALGKDLP